MTASSPTPTAPAGSSELAKSYAPSVAQEQVQRRWDQARAFHASAGVPGDARPPFCILIPPPNVTAALHLGHAFNNTLQDILTRYHRMRGFNTLWMPGTDHAGIATQTVVEKRLLLQGKKRHDFTRDEFVAKVQEWKDEYEATIISQLQAIGCSCDFERTRFTMDEVCAKAVREAFFRLFKDGLIYRGKRLVNWDPASQTALADDEVEMEEVHGHMYYLRYPLVETPKHGNAETPKWVTVATTRPETMLGDTAVAMNPKDPRATQLVGRMVKLPIVGREIPIIADDYVVMPASMGGDPSDAKAAIATGFLKVTPAHDDNDYQIGQRHPEIGLVNVFAPDATISDKHGWSDVSEESRQFIGLSREEARKRIVTWFKNRGLLEDVKPYTHSVGHSYRSHVPIEPYMSDQWYVKVTDDRMRGEALRAMSREQSETANVSPLAPGSAGGSGLQGAPKSPSSRNAGSALHPPAEPGANGNYDGQLRFFPARYAKTFQSWHENIRDWCISRQIWWGHRIPVWGSTSLFHGKSDDTRDLEHRLRDWERQGRIAILHRSTAETIKTQEDLDNPDCHAWQICVRNEGDMEVTRKLESCGYVQDPDVLDTWFSSALWPISTMGWPEPEAFPKEIPEGPALLDTFNPSTVLFTAREIITLWVSRMVMFNRHFRGGRLPFTNVYIHAMIQDGNGQKMSKSLGNGVDPRDIVHSHGADAMRFIMASIATHTQDVRLPVDMVCPHCLEAFHPKEITSPAGYRVAAAEQECPKCRKKMISGYGAATGLATPSEAIPLARNTSSKFDEGRNFANKLWNATRFALGNLSSGSASPSGAHGLQSMGVASLSLVDRWILSRLARALRAADDALADYQFKAYADAMYDFVWRDFCDWYLEAIKPTIKSDANQQRVLRTVLDAVMRMLHPMLPFVTEMLYPHIAATGVAPIDGIQLPPNDLVITAKWPVIDSAIEDPGAVSIFERVQNLVNAIRTLRSERQVPPKRKIRLAAPPAILKLIESAAGVVQTMAMLEDVQPTTGERPAGAIALTFEGHELLLSGLVDAVDASAEKARLSKVVAEKQRAVAGFEGKLNNEGYLSKAPPDKVEETRRMHAQAQADLAAAASALQSLESVAQG